FYLLALRSASPIHFGTIDANASGLWIGKESADFCPNLPGLRNSCPNSTATVFGISQDGLQSNTTGNLYLEVIVPGGQQIYIEPACGKVLYTTPHSSFKPQGSILGGWSLDTTRGGDLSFLAYLNGTFFCPVDNITDPVTRQPRGPWQMYASLPNVTLPSKQCLGANLLASNTSGPGAFEY
ncbi:hypothetical protein DOTSEDRAFT_95543, partial [Dothistroma septosporum NZE10]